MEILIKELLNRGADPDKGCEEDESDETVLHLAVVNENASVVEVLLKNGANVDVKDSVGNTPLLNAISFSGSSPKITTFLIEHGADVHVVDTDKKTCLHLAMENDNDKLVVTLLKCGVSVRAEDKNGWTPLHEAAYYGSGKSAKVLVDSGEVQKIVYSVSS